MPSKQGRLRFEKGSQAEILRFGAGIHAESARKKGRAQLRIPQGKKKKIFIKGKSASMKKRGEK